MTNERCFFDIDGFIFNHVVGGSSSVLERLPEQRLANLRTVFDVLAPESFSVTLVSFGEAKGGSDGCDFVKAYGPLPGASEIV